MISKYAFLVAVMLALMTVQGDNKLLRKRPVYEVEEAAGGQFDAEEVRNFWDATERAMKHRVLGSHRSGSDGSASEYVGSSYSSGSSSSSSSSGSSSSSSSKSSKQSKRSKASKRSKSGKKNSKKMLDSGDLFDSIMNSALSMSFTY